MVIWAIELVRVLELVVSVFPKAEDSVRERDRSIFLIRITSSSKSPRDLLLGQKFYKVIHVMLHVINSEKF